MVYTSKYQHYYWLFFVSFVFLNVLLAGCSGGGGDSKPANLQAPAHIVLPDSIDQAELVVLSGRESSKVDEEGNTKIPCLAKAPFMAVAQVNGTPVAMCLIDPGRDDNEISCLETAVALVIIRAGLLTTPDNLKPDLIAEVKNVSEVQSLGNSICDALGDDITAVVNPGPALKSALLTAEEAVIQHLKSLATAG